MLHLTIETFIAYTEDVKQRFVLDNNLHSHQTTTNKKFANSDSRSRLNLLVHVVNIGSHDRYHGGQTCSLGQVGYDLTTFDTSVVVFIDEKRFNDDQDFVDVRSNEVVQLVQDSIDDLE